jgi:hypothetical protein
VERSCKYSNFPLSEENTFWDSQWVPETMDSAKHDMYYDFFPVRPATWLHHTRMHYDSISYATMPPLHHCFCVVRPSINKIRLKHKQFDSGIIDLITKITTQWLREFIPCEYAEWR